MSDEVERAPAAPQVHAIINVHLEPFEAAVYRHEYEKAGHLMLESLRRLRAGAEFIGYQPAPGIRKILVTRLCAAITALLADPKFTLSQDGFDHLASEHAMFDMLFRLSTFETSDHMMAMIAKNPEESERAKLAVEDGAALIKYLMTFSLRSAFGLNYEDTFKRNPQALIALWSGMIAAMLVVDARAHERRELLVGLHAIFADTVPPDACLPALSDAYMYSSYSCRADKHDAKGTIHRMLEAKFSATCNRPGRERLSVRWARAREARQRGERPTVLVAIEWFSSAHAMFRCYAPAIRQLRADFRLVGMGRRMDIDEVGIAEFDEFIDIGPDFRIQTVVDQVNKLAPAAIYHPSLGMALWWVCCASLRLAPLQCMTLGHPASSRSRHMDYVLCDQSAVADPALFSERIITYPDGATRFVRRPDAAPLAPRLEDRPETINVAVPAMLVKLNAPFMAALKTINERAARPVVFHFFINMIGVSLHQAAVEIRNVLPTARIYERNAYTGYMQHLRDCDLHIATFPFGGTNSDIDSLSLGIPVLCIDGVEPHSRFDAMLMRRIGLESLVCSSVEAMIERAVELIDDHDARNAIRDRILSSDLDSAFFADCPDRPTFGETFRQMFDQHEFAA